jgi:hypothetical protein
VGKGEESGSERKWKKEEKIETRKERKQIKVKVSKRLYKINTPSLPYFSPLSYFPSLFYFLFYNYLSKGKGRSK